MAEEATPPATPIIRTSLTPAWQQACQWAGRGLLVGLFIVLGIMTYDHSKANSVSQVMQEARRPLLQYHHEKGGWPADFNLTKAAPELAAFNAKLLPELVGKCRVVGVWMFTQNGPEGKPAVVFTPSSAGSSFKRVLMVVDGWMDDGRAAAGDLRVTEAKAWLTLTAE
jgi:hypothetical protein